MRRRARLQNAPARDLLRGIQPDAFFEVIAGAGHWVQYEAPEAFDATLLRHLAALEAMRGA